MEKQIQSFTELKVGDLVLIESPALNMRKGDIVDDLCVVISITPTYKYPITDSNGRKFYMKDRKAYYADEVADGIKMINQWCISSSTMGEYTFREDDKPIWNIRLIDETHPKWDSKFSKHGQTMYDMVNMLAKMFK
jgi:hypothetical protein